MAFFDKVYPFTTESISGYMKHMDVKDKTVLTVGSSMDQAIGNKKYDRMILSNVLQYIETYRGDIPVDKFIKDNFEVFRRHLNEEGILQLLYIYNYCRNNQFLGFTTIDLLNALPDYELELAQFKSGKDNDAAIIYTKK